MVRGPVLSRALSLLDFNLTFATHVGFRGLDFLFCPDSALFAVA